jgi:hypothetical protein
MQFMPADPLGTAEKVVSTGKRVRTVADDGSGLYGWLAHGVPISALVALAGCAGLYFVLCHWLPKYMGTKS